MFFLVSCSFSVVVYKFKVRENIFWESFEGVP